MAFVKVTEDLGNGQTRRKIVVSSKLEKQARESFGGTPFKLDLGSFKTRNPKITIVKEKKIIEHHFVVKEKVKLGRI